MVVRADGEVDTIPSPLPGRFVGFPRVVAGSPGTWDAIFLETSRPRMQDIEHSDSVRLWYGRFDGRRWRDTLPIATLAGAKLSPELTSKLLRDASGDLAFAFPLGDSSGVTGALLVRRTRGRWQLDTLGTKLPVAYVRLAPGQSPGTMVALLRMPFFDDQWRLVAGSIFVALVDARWHEPVLAIRAVAGSLDEPVLHRIGRHYVAVWLESRAEANGPRLPAVRWAALDTGAPRLSSAFPVLLDEATEFASLEVSDRAVVLLSSEPRDRAQARILLLDHRGVVSRARRPLSTDFRLVPVRRTDDTFWVLTSRLARRVADPPVVNVVTPIRARC